MRQWLISHLWGLVPLGMLAVVVGAAAWYLGSPLFIRTTLVEAQPEALSLAPNASGPRQQPSSSGTSSTPGVQSQAMRVLGRGNFSDRDQVHRGSGQATLAHTADGAYLLRFEDFSVTNGPDLHVLLSKTERPSNHDEVYDGIYVGKLKASQGAFHYELPSDADVAGVHSVVIYCVPFRVIFSSAPFTAG